MAVHGSLQPSRPLPPPREARSLADWLRSSRLCVLHGAAGSGKTALLHGGVIPLLHRRATDLVVQQSTPTGAVVLPFPDRRRANGQRRSPEIAVCFDDWRAGTLTPLARLFAQIHDALGIAPPDPDPDTDPDATQPPGQHALAAALVALEARFGVRFLIVLDGFEQCLAAATERREAADFADEVAHALKRTQLPANFLIALRDDAMPQLQQLLAGVPGLTEHALHLTPPAQRPATVLRQVPPAAQADVAGDDGLKAAPAAADSAASDTEWLSSIDSIMERVNAAARSAPNAPPDLVLRDVPAPDPVALTAPDIAAAAVPLTDEPPKQTAAAPKKPRFPAWLALAALALAGLGYIGWRSDPAAPQADLPVASAPVSPPTAPAPAAVLAAAPLQPQPPSGLTDLSPTLPELARALATPELRATPVWPVGFDDVPGQPGLALARYDALQAQRGAGGKTLPLQIVAPLYTEPLLFVARADSPLAFIHDIQSARIDAGPADSGAALTAAALYQRMFGQPLAARPNAAAGGEAALGRLMRNEGVDVLVLSGPQLAEAWSRLPPATASRLKLLKRDDRHPADQRALKAYLPTTLTTTAQATPTFSVMSFLVADTPASATRAAQALCAALPELHRGGSAKWRELQAGLQLPTGWPTPAAAQQAWNSCASARR